MKSRVLGIYEATIQASQAAEVLRKRGFSSEYISGDIDKGFYEEAIGPTGILLGGIVGIIAGYLIFLTNGLNALTISNGLGAFLWTIIVVGIIGAISGGFLGSFVSFGVAQDIGMYNAYLSQGSIVMTVCDAKDEGEIYALLQRTGARKIQILTGEKLQKQVPGFLPRAYAGVKEGYTKRTKKKTRTQESASPIQKKSL